MAIKTNPATVAVTWIPIRVEPVLGGLLNITLNVFKMFIQLVESM